MADACEPVPVHGFVQAKLADGEVLTGMVSRVTVEGERTVSLTLLIFGTRRRVTLAAPQLVACSMMPRTTWRQVLRIAGEQRAKEAALS